MVYLFISLTHTRQVISSGILMVLKEQCDIHMYKYVTFKKWTGGI